MWAKTFNPMTTIWVTTNTWEMVFVWLIAESLEQSVNQGLEISKKQQEIRGKEKTLRLRDESKTALIQLYNFSSTPSQSCVLFCGCRIRWVVYFAFLCKNVVPGSFSAKHQTGVFSDIQKRERERERKKWYSEFWKDTISLFKDTPQPFAQTCRESKADGKQQQTYSQKQHVVLKRHAVYLKYTYSDNHTHKNTLTHSLKPTN